MSPLKFILLLSLFIVFDLLVNAQDSDLAGDGTFEQNFYPKTLRIDFELGGNDSTTMVFFTRNEGRAILGRAGKKSHRSVFIWEFPIPGL